MRSKLAASASTCPRRPRGPRPPIHLYGGDTGHKGLMPYMYVNTGVQLPTLNFAIRYTVAVRVRG